MVIGKDTEIAGYRRALTGLLEAFHNHGCTSHWDLETILAVNDANRVLSPPAPAAAPMPPTPGRRSLAGDLFNHESMKS